MARVQVGGVSAPEALRTTLSPSLQMVQQRQDRTAGTQSAQLAEALGIGANFAQQKAVESADAEAKKVLNSMTIDELGKKLKSGEIAPNQSPLFMATLNGMYGENLRSKLERDTIEKMETGELQFNTPEELDKYITEARGSYLTEVDPNAIKGFDSKFNQMRQGLLNAQGKITASVTVERMTGEATQFIINEVKTFREGNPEATAADVAAHVMNLDNNLRGMAPLPPKLQKQVLKGALNEFAANGEYELLKEALSIKQPSGQTGATLIGMDTARQLLSIAENNFDKGQRARVDGDITGFFEKIRSGEFNEKEFTEWYKSEKNAPYVSAGSINSIYGMVAAQARQDVVAFDRLQKEREINAALSEINRGINLSIQAASIGVPPGDLPETVVAGGQTFYPRKMLEKRVEESIGSRLAANQMTISQATAELATLGTKYEPWTQLFNRGASLIDSANFQVNGKPGEFNPKLAEAIETYSEVYATSPSLAKTLAGGNYELFETMAFAKSAGIQPDIAVEGYRNMKNFDKLDPVSRKEVEKISASVSEDLLQPNWLMDIFGEEQPQFPKAYEARIKGMVSFFAKGYGGTAEEVKQLVTNSLKANTVVIGNKAYMASDLPDFAGSRAEMKPILRERVLGILAAQTKQERAVEGAVNMEALELRANGDNISVYYEGWPVAWRTQGPNKRGTMVFTKKDLEAIAIKREGDDAAALASTRKPGIATNAQPMVAP